MGTRQLLTEASKALGIAGELRLVEPYRYRAVLEHIIEARTLLSKDAVSAPWWWEALRPPTASCQPADAIDLLSSLVPVDELLWLVIEADETPAKREGNFWLYEARIGAITRVLRELLIPPCEYYIVGKKCDWLLCENHHGLLIASGEGMTSRLLTLPRLDTRNRQEGMA